MTSLAKQNLFDGNVLEVDIGIMKNQSPIKGGYLDFAHLTELKNIYINKII